MEYIVFLKNYNFSRATTVTFLFWVFFFFLFFFLQCNPCIKFEVCLLTILPLSRVSISLIGKVIKNVSSLSSSIFRNGLRSEVFPGNVRFFRFKQQTLFPFFKWNKIKDIFFHKSEPNNNLFIYNKVYII